MKKLTSVLLASAMLVSLGACGGGTSSTAPTSDASSSTPAAEAPAAESTASTSEEAPADTAPADGEQQYIAVVSKGFQHQFWQVVKKGADAAAADFNVRITFNGPPTESDIDQQVNMLNTAMNENPAAICLAALDTNAMLEQLNTCKNKGIPVVGFDSGVPNAPEGSIYATASTDNAAAAGIAAEHLFNDERFKAKFDAATADAPILVGVLSQDATSDSIIQRTSGFVDKFVELAGAENVSVTGHDKYAKAVDGAKVLIEVNVPASTSAENMKAGAELLLTKNPVAIYGSNENGAGGILAASNDGKDFASDGKYKDIIALGFDAGKTQRTAVENGWFIGSVTQDPYQIGYKAVELAVKAIKGEPAASPIVDTGAKWYDAEALKDPSISELVYE